MTQKGNEMAAVEPNLEEVTKEALVLAEIEKIKAREEEDIKAEAAAKVEADFVAKALAKREAEQAKANEEAKVEAAKKRLAGLKTYTTALGKWMVEHDCDNPITVPSTVVDSLRAQAGL
jgi:hypothetical protein